MKPFPVSVLPELSALGDMRTLEGVFEEEQVFSVGGQDYTLPAGVSYSIQLSNTGEAVLLSGTVEARVVGRCARCLEPAECDVAGSAEGYFFIEQVDESEIEGMEPDEYGFVDEHGDVDVSDALLAGLVHELPFVMLCKEDCAGLCPSCGANLNEGSCDCDADQVDSLSPFAALKDFKFADE